MVRHVASFRALGSTPFFAKRRSSALAHSTTRSPLPYREVRCTSARNRSRSRERPLVVKGDPLGGSLRVRLHCQFLLLREGHIEEAQDHLGSGEHRSACNGECPPAVEAKYEPPATSRKIGWIAGSVPASAGSSFCRVVNPFFIFNAPGSTLGFFWRSLSSVLNSASSSPRPSHRSFSVLAARGGTL